MSLKISNFFEHESSVTNYNNIELILTKYYNLQFVNKYAPKSPFCQIKLIARIKTKIEITLTLIKTPLKF